MYSRRYGCLHTIAARTGHRCHLCHGSIDVTLYGRIGAFGGEEATVDHLQPQSLGGIDEADNLLIAHGRCNATRGTRPVADVRAELAGVRSRPASTGENLVVGATASVFALGAGYAFREADEFNWRAAGLAGAAALVMFTLGS